MILGGTVDAARSSTPGGLVNEGSHFACGRLLPLGSLNTNGRLDGSGSLPTAWWSSMRWLALRTQKETHRVRGLALPERATSVWRLARRVRGGFWRRARSPGSGDLMAPARSLALGFFTADGSAQARRASRSLWLAHRRTGVVPSSARTNQQGEISWHGCALQHGSSHFVWLALHLRASCSEWLRPRALPVQGAHRLGQRVDGDHEVRERVGHGRPTAAERVHVADRRGEDLRDLAR